MGYARRPLAMGVTLVSLLRFLLRSGRATQHLGWYAAYKDQDLTRDLVTPNQDVTTLPFVFKTCLSMEVLTS
ncbi:hypothetical protein F5Y09DRAFT_312019 [Xylaria sp. FL1042]|nr:hypothetical protein F5Y09DRAFT_312019 [Xylaria sp. FL1042]